ncbi:MAG: dTDP-glucose 4,6-dehydratase [Nocardioidaceae bacterium]|nr:dTDP-glucose 4,6-dehydratase [Nocardioidaceae bacterium]
MRKLLVTGAAGFIGANFVHYWTKTHPDDQIVAYDLLTYAGSEANLESVVDRITFIRGDICDQTKVEEVLAQHGIDAVVNFAAESHNSLAVLDPGRFFETNVVGTQRMLEACRRRGVQRFHHVSTCEVYGDMVLDDEGAFTEDSPYRPRTPYNASKAAADHAVRAYRETFGLPVTITNCSNNYGPYQFPEKVIPVFVTNAMQDQPLPVYATSQNRREWLHVDDHCRAIDAVLTRGRVGETYNIGSGHEASVQQLADVILRILHKPASLVTTVPDRPGHDRRYLLDSGKVRDELGWTPHVEFETGIEDTIRWYADNVAWWAPLLERRPVDERAWQSAPA